MEGETVQVEVAADNPLVQQGQPAAPEQMFNDPDVENIKQYHRGMIDNLSDPGYVRAARQAAQVVGQIAQTATSQAQYAVLNSLSAGLTNSEAATLRREGEAGLFSTWEEVAERRDEMLAARRRERDATGQRAAAGASGVRGEVQQRQQSQSWTPSAKQYQSMTREERAQLTPAQRDAMAARLMREAQAQGEPVRPPRQKPDHINKHFKRARDNPW